MKDGRWGSRWGGDGNLHEDTWRRLPQVGATMQRGNMGSEGQIKARYKEIKTLPVLAPQRYGLTLTLSFFPILRALRSNCLTQQELNSSLSSSLSPLCSPQQPDHWLNYQMTKMMILVMTELICSQKANPRSDTISHSTAGRQEGIQGLGIVSSQQHSYCWYQDFLTIPDIRGDRPVAQQPHSLLPVGDSETNYMHVLISGPYVGSIQED